MEEDLRGWKRMERVREDLRGKERMREEGGKERMIG